MVEYSLAKAEVEGEATRELSIPRAKLLGIDSQGLIAINPGYQSRGRSGRQSSIRFCECYKGAYPVRVMGGAVGRGIRFFAHYSIPKGPPECLMNWVIIF